MWLLNATTQEQRQGLADYFSPNNVMARTTSGFGQPFGGTTPNIDGSLTSTKGAVQVVMSPPHPVIDNDDDEGDIPARQSTQRTTGPSLVPTARDGGTAVALRAPPADPDPQADPALQDRPDQDAPPDRRPTPANAAPVTSSPATPAPATPAPVTSPPANTMPANGARADAAPPAADPYAAARAAAERAEAERQERQLLERAAQAIQDAVRADPALASIADQLKVDLMPEGLRIQVVDADKQPMFATGSAALNDRARALLAKVAPVLLRLPEGISVAGHTDAQPYRGGDRSNWDLSADRANATRRLLTDAGLPEARIRAVAGHADREPLIATDPLAAANRRVAILVLRDVPLRNAGRDPGRNPGARDPAARDTGVRDAGRDGSARPAAVKAAAPSGAPAPQPGR